MYHKQYEVLFVMLLRFLHQSLHTMGGPIHDPLIKRQRLVYHERHLQSKLAGLRMNADSIMHCFEHAVVANCNAPATGQRLQAASAYGKLALWVWDSSLAATHKIVTQEPSAGHAHLLKLEQGTIALTLLMILMAPFIGTSIVPSGCKAGTWSSVLINQSAGCNVILVVFYQRQLEAA